MVCLERKKVDEKSANTKTMHFVYHCVISYKIGIRMTWKMVKPILESQDIRLQFYVRMVCLKPTSTPHDTCSRYILLETFISYGTNNGENFEYWISIYYIIF